MKTIRKTRRMQSEARALAASGKRIGLVPTMGYLHEGHLALIHRARKLSDVVVVTIFVNPAQFGPREDLAKYPRDEKGDLKKIRQAGGDIAFVPTVDDIYPSDFQSWVEVKELTRTLEGESRPTHFRGVTTVVTKLYNIIRPDVAVFGQKDYHQAIVLRQLTRDLGYPIKFVIAPTVREKDGLAMSSRNRYFSPEERGEAVALYRALTSARALAKSGERSAAKIRREMTEVLLATCPSANIEYIAFTEFDSLQPVKKIDEATIASLAVKIHGVRLIDNMKLL